MQEMIKRAKELLKDGSVSRVLGWKNGDLAYNPEPCFFRTEEELDQLVYNGFCGANLSKYMIQAGKKEGKTLVFLKPCDTYSYNQLLKEHRVARQQAYIIGVGCSGNYDMERVKNKGIKGTLSIREQGDQLEIHTLYGDVTIPAEEALLERCRFCKGNEHKIYDELLNAERKTPVPAGDRMELVANLEAMTAEERFSFWQKELSRCIRCNACRNACPACTCRTCVFDSDKFDSSQKANVDAFEEKMFHIVRAFHVAGRCTDCGECSRVCPQGIPLYLLNRKFIKEINHLYGEFQAGDDAETTGPLTSFTMEDAEPSIITERR